MITIEQCRGARGILAWTQQDLADASGLSKTAINNFEKAHSDIKAESLRAIQKAFEKAEIEFIGREGVTKKLETVRMLRGPSALNDLMDDIYNTIINKNSDILISNVDQSISSRISTQKLFRHIEIIKKHNISERVLCPTGTHSIFSPQDECRWLPAKHVTESIRTFIYAGKVAFELWDETMIIVINSQEASDAERKRFETRWASAEVLAGNQNLPGQKSKSA